jgi:hypothetical protein
VRGTPKQLLAFHTGLLALDYNRFPQPPYKGNGWHLDFVEPVSALPIGSAIVDDKIYPAKEVMLWAKSEVDAQRAADLIHAGRLLIDGSNLLSHIYPGEHAPIQPANNNGDSNNEDLPGFPPGTLVMTPLIPLACLVATSASLRLQYVYAMAKIRLSFETYSLPAMELDPQRRDNVPKSRLPEDHVRLAFAIVMAYSCIEELGFAIHASSNKPSKIDGRWNPVVKEELEARLRRGHINLQEAFHWNLRGPRTLIEKRRLPEIVQKAKWARFQVRDGKMEVIDAINYVSFLRSKVSAHKADKRLVRVLAVYDVANAQFLARRLLLEKMGFWRYWGSAERKQSVAPGAK